MVHTPHVPQREAEALHDRFVATMAAPDVWALLMRSAALHCQYGPVNVMLIAAQQPDASDVRARSEWERLGHQVVEDARAIQIFTPSHIESARPAR